MFVFIEKWLILSMKMEKSPVRLIRILGRLLGYPPVWFIKRLEKKVLKDD